MRSQPGFLASLAANVLPFAYSLAHKPGPSSSQETWDTHTAGKGGSQSSTSYAYPTDLFDASQNVAIPPQGGLFDGSPLVAALPPQGGVPGVVTLGQTQTQTLTVTAQTQNDDDENDPTPNPASEIPPQGGSHNPTPPPPGGAGDGGGDGGGGGGWG